MPEPRAVQAGTSISSSGPGDGLTPQQKKDAAQQAGVHPDMLRFHSDARILSTGEFWIDV